MRAELSVIEQSIEEAESEDAAELVDQLLESAESLKEWIIEASQETILEDVDWPIIDKNATLPPDTNVTTPRAQGGGGARGGGARGGGARGGGGAGGRGGAGGGDEGNDDDEKKMPFLKSGIDLIRSMTLQLERQLMAKEPLAKLCLVRIKFIPSCLASDEHICNI